MMAASSSNFCSLPGRGSRLPDRRPLTQRRRRWPAVVQLRRNVARAASASADALLTAGHSPPAVAAPPVGQSPRWWFGLCPDMSHRGSSSLSGAVLSHCLSISGPADE